MKLVAFVIAAIGGTACLTPFDESRLEAGSHAGGSAPTPGPSCHDDDPLCQEVSCCEALAVPGGTFSRGWDRSNSPTQSGGGGEGGGVVTGFQDEGEAPATISAFSLDTYEVTVARFRRFADAYDDWRKDGHPKSGEGAHPRIPGSGWDDSWPVPETKEELIADIDCHGDADATFGGDALRPINCVSWYTAFMFCVWDGGRLPTEAEWFYAAAGGAEQRAFPWSKPAYEREIDLTFAVYGDLPPDEVGSRRGMDDGLYGHHDLAGNVREWVLDTGGSLDEYAFDPCVDCAVLVDGDKVHRGGDSRADATRARTAYRSADPPDQLSTWIGVRCAR